MFLSIPTDNIVYFWNKITGRETAKIKTHNPNKTFRKYILFFFSFSDTSFEVPRRYNSSKDTLITESSTDNEVNVTGPSVLSLPAPKPGVDVYQHVNMMMKVSLF